MFQFKLVFQLEHPYLPRELDRLLVSFLKSSVENYSKDLYEKLYDKTKSIIKTYTFSYYLPGAKFQENIVDLKQNRFTLFFSDADVGQAIHFFNAFRLMKNKKYPMSGNSMQLVSVFMQKKERIVDSEIVVKMQNSLIVRRHNSDDNTDIYFTYDQEGFGEVLKENIEFFLKKCNIALSSENFEIVPVKGKKLVAPVFGRNVDSNLGVYKLTGNPELLNILYLAGMGSRRSEGHGKFEIIC